MAKVLFIGDVMGKPGRRLVQALLPELRERLQADFVIANAENAAGGAGLVQKAADELFDSGVDALTGGNHIFKNVDIYKFIDDETRLVRPANFPAHPRLRGEGCALFQLPNGEQLAVINLLGTVLMKELDNPFHCVDAILDELSGVTPNIFVDFHAEVTSEKVAMGWHLDGRATAVIGTHTHVPTADERLLHQGTAFQTDTGMTGPYDSVIGVKKEIILDGYLSKLPVRHVLATGEVAICGALIEFDPKTGRASSIMRIRENQL